ncbi:unnamed protein product [Phytophthora fragariaefolia]|uniref:Unnamed protein product n=1 Tax=Phytophthora fragariaefolia TaxID=1490495 RepID=A0A9W6YGJ3_9STRA|nr:unnamed protein product [Phytophthora fragariaefolia]
MSAPSLGAPVRDRYACCTRAAPTRWGAIGPLSCITAAPHCTNSLPPHRYSASADVVFASGSIIHPSALSQPVTHIRRLQWTATALGLPGGHIQQQQAAMISPKVMSELHQAKLVPTQFTVPKPGEHAWSPAEQRRFWEAIQRFPQGPWTAIAAYVGSKSTRQAMTHAQKLRQKLSRWKRRVRSDSVSSTGSNSSASASVMTPVDDSTGSQSPPTSPSEYGQIAKLSIMDHIEEEDEKKSTGEDDCEPMEIKSEFKDEAHQLADHEQVHDAHDDRYLEHLLTDIEPVLEHVAHFTNGGHGHSAEDATRPVSTTEYSDEHAVYFTHNVDMADSEHKTVELSWNQHQDPAYYHQQQHHHLMQHHHQQHQEHQTQQYDSMHYTPTDNNQHSYHHHL